MKLSRPDRPFRGGGRGYKAADALRPAELPAEGFFDIRRFLKSNDVQFMKMMSTVVNPQPDDHEVFISMSWLGRLDPELDDHLKKSLGFKEFILEKFETSHQEHLGWGGPDGKDAAFFVSLAQAYLLLFQGMQTFPELRQDTQVQEKLSQEYPDFLKVIDDPATPLGDRVPLASLFSVLLPEHRTELIQTLLKPYDGQVENLLADSELQTGEIQTLPLGILLFPEQADQIKELMRPQESAMAEEWEAVSKKPKHMSELESYFGQAFILSLLTAEKVIISPDGQLEFKLKPAPATPPAPLPDRPLA